MSRNARQILSLLVAALVIGAMAAAYIWSTRRADMSDPEDAAHPNGDASPTTYTLSDRAQTEVSRISVRHGDGVARLFLPGEAVGDRFIWYMADHPEYILDNWSVQNLLRPAFTLTAHERAHEDTHGMDLTEFGLDPPQAVFTAHYTNGGTASIYLGNETPDRQRFFVMVSGDPAMYLLPRFTVSWMLSEAEDLLCRAFPPLHTDSLTLFYLAQRGRDTLEITRTDDPELLATLPDMGFAPAVALQPPALAGRTADTFNLNRMVLEDFFAGFRLGDVADIAPDDLAPFGLDDPYIDFRFETDDGFVHLRFGDTLSREIDGQNVPHIYVMHNDRPHVFMAELSAVNPIIDLNVMHFITRFIALVNILDVERIGVTHGTVPERNLDMVINHDFSQGNNDIFPTINGVSVEAASFRTLYRLLISIGADSPLDPSPPQGTPAFTVTFYLLDGTQTKIDFYDFDGNFYTFSLDGDYVWAVTNRRGVEAFFAETERLLTSPQG